jgi:hypothetical protein
MDAINFQTARAQLGNTNALDAVYRITPRGLTASPVSPVAPVHGRSPLTTEQALTQAAANAVKANQTTASQPSASQAAASRAKIASRLVAGVVPGGVSFAATPADKNIAATGVQAGRVIDVVG